jgi:hypothetical protein
VNERLASGTNVSDAATAVYAGVTPDRLMFCVVRRVNAYSLWLPVGGASRNSSGTQQSP